MYVCIFAWAAWVFLIVWFCYFYELKHELMAPWISNERKYCSSLSTRVCFITVSIIKTIKKKLRSREENKKRDKLITYRYILAK